MMEEFGTGDNKSASFVERQSNEAALILAADLKTSIQSADRDLGARVLESVKHLPGFMLSGIGTEYDEGKGGDKVERFDPPKKIIMTMPDEEKLEMNVATKTTLQRGSGAFEQYQTTKGEQPQQVDLYVSNDGVIRSKWNYYSVGQGPQVGPPGAKFAADTVESSYEHDSGKIETFSAELLGWDTQWRRYYNNSGIMTSEGWYFTD